MTSRATTRLGSRRDDTKSVRVEVMYVGSVGVIERCLDSATEGPFLLSAVFLPPELCEIHPLSIPAFLAAKHLPCVLWWLRCLAAAKELREKLLPKNASPDRRVSVRVCVRSCAEVPCCSHAGLGKSKPKTNGKRTRTSHWEIARRARADCCPIGATPLSLAVQGRVLLHCAQWRWRICRKLPDLAAILEALMPTSCQQGLSYERLEIIGDAYLKFETTLHCFRAFPLCHEGAITIQRSFIGGAISNFLKTSRPSRGAAARNDARKFQALGSPLSRNHRNTLSSTLPRFWETHVSVRRSLVKVCTTPTTAGFEVK